MSRFSSLELDESAPTPVNVQQPVGDKPRDGEFYLDLAKESFWGCDYEKALENYSKVLSFDSVNVSAWLGQVRCLMNLNEFKEASLWTDKAMEVIGEIPELLAIKATAFCRMGDFSRAFGLSDVSLEKKGSTPLVWICRGEVLLQRDSKNAEFCFQKALSNGESWEIRLEIARVYLFYNKNVKAFEHLRAAMESHPSQPAVWYELGKCHLNLGEKGKSVEAFQRALELNSNFKAASNALGTAKRTGFLSSLTRKLFKR